MAATSNIIVIPNRANCSVFEWYHQLKTIFKKSGFQMFPVFEESAFRSPLYFPAVFWGVLRLAFVILKVCLFVFHVL